MGPGSGPACDIRLNTALSPEERRQFQDVGTIRRLLRESRTIAIVGLSSDPWKASSFVATYLQREGYRIVPVTPRAGVILGERTYPDLASIPFRVDLVDVFRPAQECLAVAEQAIAAGAPAIWFQLRIPAREAAERAAAAGLAVVLDRCVKMEHGRWAGSLHWAGMNTEIISARRPRMVPA
ncbi:MAG TPA: CoA-binding protein [Gemmatimonadales bacterium]|nr:CoA-binding protein [Gemmatimonadales bacterium]